jgi:hypothetical protein
MMSQVFFLAQEKRLLLVNFHKLTCSELLRYQRSQSGEIWQRGKKKAEKLQSALDLTIRVTPLLDYCRNSFQGTMAEGFRVLTCCCMPLCNSWTVQGVPSGKCKKISLLVYIC